MAAQAAQAIRCTTVRVKALDEQATYRLIPASQSEIPRLVIYRFATGFIVTP